MSAPRKICATEPGRAGHMFANAQRLEDAPYLYHHDDVVRGLVDKIASLKRMLNLGCDANSGGKHNAERQGNYFFCRQCGETLPKVRWVHPGDRAALAKFERGDGT